MYDTSHRRDRWLPQRHGAAALMLILLGAACLLMFIVLNPPIRDHRSEFYRPHTADKAIDIDLVDDQYFDLMDQPCRLQFWTLAIDRTFTIYADAKDEGCRIEARVDRKNGEGFTIPLTRDEQGGPIFAYDASVGEDFDIVYRACQMDRDLSDDDCFIVLVT